MIRFLHTRRWCNCVQARIATNKCKYRTLVNVSFGVNQKKKKNLIPDKEIFRLLEMDEKRLSSRLETGLASKRHFCDEYATPNTHSALMAHNVCLTQPLASLYNI